MRIGVLFGIRPYGRACRATYGRVSLGISRFGDCAGVSIKSRPEVSKDDLGDRLTRVADQIGQQVAGLDPGLLIGSDDRAARAPGRKSTHLRLTIFPSATMRHTSAGGIRARTVPSNSRADDAAKPIPVTSDIIAVPAISIPDQSRKIPCSLFREYGARGTVFWAV